MRLSGYPNLLSFHRQSRTIADLRANLQTASTEAITGKYEDIAKATRGNVGEVHLLEQALNGIEQNKRLNSLSSTRLQMTTQALSGARAAVNNLDARAVIALASGSQVSTDLITDEARANLFSTMSALSMRQGNRNLLSGNMPDTPTFAGADALLADIDAIMSGGGSPADIESALDTYFEPGGDFDSQIYTGGDNPASPLRLGDGSMLNVDVRGNHPAIKNVLRGLAVLATIDSSGFAKDSREYADVYSQATSVLADGNSALIRTESDLGIYSETIEKANTRDNFEQLSLSEAYRAIVVRDQFEAAAQLKELQGQIESAYLITSRLSDLTLSNYLR